MMIETVILVLVISRLKVKTINLQVKTGSKGEISKIENYHGHIADIREALFHWVNDLSALSAQLKNLS